MPERRKSHSEVAQRIGVLWCRLMHAAPMWPIHGTYRCRTCGRSYLVPWADEHVLQPDRLVIQPRERIIETGA